MDSPTPDEADDPPPLTLDLLNDADGFEAAVLGIAAADPHAAARTREIEPLLCAIRSQLDPGTWAQLAELLRLVGQRGDELLVVVAKRAVEDTGSALGADGDDDEDEP